MASTVPATGPGSDVGDVSFQSSTTSPDTSSLSLESSFRLEATYANESVECEKHPKGKRKRTTWVLMDLFVFVVVMGGG